MGEAAAINDFADLSALSKEMSTAAPSLAAALEEAASAYDEAAIAAFLERVRAEKQGAKDGR